MAERKFLVDINLDQNQLTNAVIENQGTAPGSPTEGQIYYDTDDNSILLWNGSSWVDLGSSGVTNLTTAYAATNITVESSTGTDAVVNAATGSLAGVMTAADKTKLDGIATGAEVNVDTDLGNTPAASDVLVTSSTGVDTTLPAATTSLAGVMTGADKTKLDGITGDGTTNISVTEAPTNVAIASSSGTGDVIEIADATNAGVMSPGDFTKLLGIEALADVTDATNVAAAGATMDADTSLAGNGWFLDEDNMVSDDDTKVPSQQSVKAYVDNAVVGAITYVGPYNATTNTPDLSTNPNGTSKGDMYVVSVAGTITGPSGSVPLEVGDSLIANIDDAEFTTAGEWTFIERAQALPIASETEAGIVELATAAETITGTDDTRAVHPAGLAAALSAAVTVGRYSETVGDGAATSYVINHALGNQYVTVQLYETSSGDLVEAAVSLTDANNLSVSFNTAPTSAQYTIIVIG